MKPGEEKSFTSPCGNSGISISSRLNNPNNGDKEVLIALTNPCPGTWNFSLYGSSITNGRFDAWINDEKSATFQQSQSDSSITLTDVGSTTKVISVGSYVTRPYFQGDSSAGNISSFSSHGPRRLCSTCTNVFKPDIAAPGQWIMSAFSIDTESPNWDLVDPSVDYILKQGTSQASPHVTGAVALMLQKNPFLTPEDVKNYLLQTTRADSYTGGTPNYIWGYGKLDAYNAFLAVPTYTVDTYPLGLQITVDGSTYTAPQTFGWTPGSQHTVSVPSPQSRTAGTQYVFNFWSDTGNQSHTITVPSSSKTYTANFITQYSLKVYANPPGAGAVNLPADSWYDNGVVISNIWATANPGYSFSNWSGDIFGTTNPASITINGPKTVTANFTQIQYSLTVNINPPGGGSVSKNPNKSTYVYNEQVSVTATANPGYTFSNWSGDASGLANPTTITMNGNKTVTANFTQNPPSQYTLTININPSGSGSVSKNPDKSTYTNGEQVILTATANPGYTFTNWTGAVPNPPNPNSSIQITITGNTSVTANFTQNQYTLTVTIAPSTAAGSVTKESEQINVCLWGSGNAHCQSKFWLRI